MVIVLLGKSASGKTTLAKRMKERFNIDMVVTCTTRPMREGEKQGIDYNFLTYEEAIESINKGEFIEYVEYTVHGGDKWIYGTRFKDIDINKNQLIVLNPTAYKTLKGFFKDKLFAIELKPFELKRIFRIIRRDKKNLLEAFRRYKSDMKDFNNLETDIVLKSFKF